MPRNVYDTEKKTCDRSGFDFKKSQLKKQRGLWVSDMDFDITDRIHRPRTRWQSPRDNDTTVTTPAEAVPEVLTVSAVTGVNQLFQSHELSIRRDGRHKSIFMKIVSDGGAITISAADAIIDGTFEGDLLTLKGTSDTDTVTIPPGVNVLLRLAVSMTLSDGDSISFVWTETGAAWGTGPWGQFPWGVNNPAWRETSRFKGGV